MSYALVVLFVTVAIAPVFVPMMRLEEHSNAHYGENTRRAIGFLGSVVFFLGLIDAVFVMMFMGSSWMLGFDWGGIFKRNPKAGWLLAPFMPFLGPPMWVLALIIKLFYGFGHNDN